MIIANTDQHINSNYFVLYSRKLLPLNVVHVGVSRGFLFDAAVPSVDQEVRMVDPGDAVAAHRSWEIGARHDPAVAELFRRAECRSAGALAALNENPIERAHI